MKTLNISAVSYLNTYPFVYGIRRSGFLRDFHLFLDVPSLCAERLKTGEADVALVPAGALPDFQDYQIITDYCIGAVKEVVTVLLLSQKPLHEIKKIHLDFDSRTSARLVQVLAHSYWKIEPEFERLKPGEAEGAGKREAIVAIGDKTFSLKDQYPYSYDLADEWIKFTSLPFVFAVWVTTKSMPAETISSLNQALKFGTGNIEGTLEYFSSKLPPNADCRKYLTENISYDLDKQKREGLNLFLSYLVAGSKC